VPLTFGNAVIAITAENNRLFPERPVTAGFAIWNIGAGFIAGIITQELIKRKVFKI